MDGSQLDFLISVDTVAEFRSPFAGENARPVEFGAEAGRELI